MVKPDLTDKDLFWVQNQIRAKYPEIPTKQKRKPYHIFAILTAFQLVDNKKRGDYKGLIDRDDLKFLTGIPRTTLFDNVKSLIEKEAAEKVTDPNPTRLRGRQRTFYRRLTQN
jgi:hypothetical protein